MVLQIILEIVVACFAVLGLYHSVCWIAQKLFGSRRLAVAIEILTQRDAESAEVLIRDALSQYLSLPSERVVVLTLPELSSVPALRRAVEIYGLDCYVIDERTVKRNGE